MVYGLAVLLVVSPAATAAGEIRAGVAHENFELPSKVPLAGYSRRKGTPSHGVHDPVGVRALVMQDAKTTAVLVSCDLLIIDEPLFDAVRQRLLAQGMPQNLILMLAATHTHSGPGAYGKRFLEKLSMGHFDPRVFEAIVQHIVHVVLQAHAARSPVRMAVQSATTSGLVKNRVHADGVADGELAVCAFYREGERQPYVVVVGFAAHPTTLGAWNLKLSADYPGVVEREVERHLPTATCLFVAGAVGDQAPVKHGSGFETADWIGREIAERAVELLRQVDVVTPRDLEALQDQVRLPPARVRLGWLTFPRWLGAQFVDDDATLSLITVGDAAFIGVPCDLSVEFGQSLKAAARSKGWHPVVVGFASDYIGYCIPSSLYEERVYESSMAFNGPTTGELIVNHLKQMIDRVATSNKEQGTRNSNP